MKSILLCFFLSVICAAGAQTFINKAAITVQNAATLNINGDFTNSDAGTIDLGGEMQVSGYLINNASTNCFVTSAGKVKLTGGTQLIRGSMPFYFPVLELSAGDKMLSQNMLVGNTPAGAQPVLIMNDGNLYLSSRTVIINSPAANAITRNNGFIVNELVNDNYGMVQWNTGNAAAGSTYTIPFGNAGTGHYTPVKIKITQSGSGISGNIEVATYATPMSGVPNNRPLPAGVTHMNNSTNGDASSKSVDRFWTIKAQQFSTLPVMDLFLQYRDMEWNSANGSTNTINENLLQAQRFQNDVWTSQPSSINTVTNEATIPNVSSSFYAWRLTEVSTALPLNWLSFTAKLNNQGYTDIKWSTAQEINCNRFEIEKSGTGTSFTRIATVAAAGNGTSIQYYNEADKNVAEGKTFYRIRQVDNDGRFTYSKIEVVEKRNANSFTIYPIPASDIINIKINTVDRPPVFCKIVDATGKMVDSWSVPLNDMISTRNISRLPAGNYVVMCITESSAWQRSFVVSR